MVLRTSPRAMESLETTDSGKACRLGPVRISRHVQVTARSANTTGVPWPSIFNLQVLTLSCPSFFDLLRIDVGALQDGKTLPQTAQWASVTLATSGLPDEVVAVAASYDQSLHYGAQTPFSDQLAAHWVGGQWDYDPQHDSITTAGNGGTKPTQTAFTIFYNQGTQKYQLEQTLQPGEQMWMDIGKLIRENVPDKTGKTLPPDLTTGSYEFRDLTNKGVGSLFEGKIIYDKTYGHVTYGCALCCGWSIPTPLWYDPISVIITSFQDDGVYAWYPCENQYDDVSTAFYNGWSSGAPSVVTVDYYGTHHGVAAGSTTSQTFGVLQSNNVHLMCPNHGFTPSGSANVTTPSQHTYPNAPLSGCRVSVPYDGVINQTTGKRHQAQDTVAPSIQVGTPVYAPEAGTITNFVSGQPHDSRPVSQCAGQNSPANFIEIQSDSDGALTRLYHVTILPSLATRGTHVAGGQQIGTIDISGCTSAPHTHIQRKVNGVLVNFTMPCINSQFDDPSTYYDDSDGTWP